MIIRIHNKVKMGVFGFVFVSLDFSLNLREYYLSLKIFLKNYAEFGETTTFNLFFQRYMMKCDDNEQCSKSLAQMKFFTMILSAKTIFRYVEC